MLKLNANNLFSPKIKFSPMLLTHAKTLNQIILF